MSPIHIIAMLVKKIDLSKIPKDRVEILRMPIDFDPDKSPKTYGEFKKIIEEDWDGVYEKETEQEEGDFGIDGSGIVHVLTPDGWHFLSEFKTWQLCAKCLSDNVFALEWVNINNRGIDKNVICEDSSIWCGNCNKITTGTISFAQLRTLKQGGKHDSKTSEVSESNT